jgi:predicted anti-sigma-YlaC factor YlaD
MFFSLLTCKETLARLDDYLDRELSPHDLKMVERHLKMCRHCAQIFAFETDLLNEMKEKVQRLEVDGAQVKSLMQRIKNVLPDAE